MRTALLATLTGGLLWLPVAAQTSACDLNQDASVNVVDVQASVNMSLGLTTCTANIYGAGVCNVIVVQRVVNAAMGGTCVTGTGGIPHSVTLNWTASITPGVSYNVYRAATSGGPFTKLNSSAVTSTNYIDNTVQAGQTYYYVATAVNGGAESIQSNQVVANIPTP